MGSSPVGLPPGFELDPELPAGFTLDEPGFAAAGAANPRGAAEELLTGALRGGGRAALSLVNPVDWGRAVYALGKLGVKLAKPPMMGQPYEGAQAIGDVVQGAKDIAGHALTSPEAMGEVIGSTAVGLAGPKIVGGALGGLVPTELSRAYNIKRALRVPLGKGGRAMKVAKDVEAMAPEIDLPVTASTQGLARALAKRRAVTGASVGEAEAALPASQISVGSIAGRMEPPPGQWARNAEGVLEFVPDDPQALARYQEAAGAFERAGGAGGEITAQDALRMKRSAQAMAAEKGSYATEELKSAAEAAKAKATALRQTLEALPGPESVALTRANRAHQVASTIEPLAEAEAVRLRSLPLMSRGVEMLLGRAVPGSGFARQALSGLAFGQILDSTLFQTATAAVKRSVIDALQSGQPQRARDILLRATIADVERRRLASQALAAQGEGVTTP